MRGGLGRAHLGGDGRLNAGWAGRSCRAGPGLIHIQLLRLSTIQYPSPRPGYPIKLVSARLEARRNVELFLYTASTCVPPGD